MRTARFDSFRLKVICVALIAVYPALAEAGVAGRVQFVAGDVRAVDDKGNERVLRKGQDVNEGDTLLSGPRGSAQLRMIDGAIVAVRPGTELKVIDYVFNEKEEGKESATFSLVKGGLRAITGLIGKTNKDKYKITTPTATIGIRGTDHEPVVVLPVSAGGVAGAPPGTYDKVNVGATTLTNQAGTTVVAANQVGFAASPTQLPVILPKLPDFYRATPAPEQQGQEQEQKQEQKQKQAQASAESSEEADSTGSARGEARTEAAAVAKAVKTVLAARLTGVDVDGNTLNLADRILRTASGESLTLDDVASALRNLTADTELLVAYPGQISDSTGPEGTFAYPAVYYFDGPSRSVSRDAAGNLAGVTNSGDDLFGFRSSLSQSGAVMTDLGKDAATGLSWGRWHGGQVKQSSQHVGMDANGNWGLGAFNDSGAFVIGATHTNEAALGNGSLHWISGSTARPDYLPQVLTGTANYSLIGGTRPTDQHGNAGTLNSARLGVNFTTGVVNANLNFSISGNNWGMQSGDMSLDDRHFSSNQSCTDLCASTVTLTKNGAPVSQAASPDAGFAFGSMNGSLVGAGLNGAALQYAIQEWVSTTTVDSGSGQSFTSFSNNVIQGVAGFSGPTQDVSTPFRMVGVTDGWGSGLDMIDDAIVLDGGGFYRGSLDGGPAPAARVVGGSGGLTEFLGEAEGYTPVTATGTSSTDLETFATIKIGSAVNRDVGSVNIGDTTVSWGRWEAGSVDIYSRDGTVKLGTIDNSERSIHWLASSVLTSAAAFTSLPLTGSATYTLAGNTNPTDFKGNVGTLNSATLNADFSNGKVNAGVNVSFNAPTNTSNWNMTANNIPLSGRDGFGSSTALNGVNGITHTTTCTGASCGAQTIGHVDGVFFGGGQGAVIMYGMATGTAAPATGSSSSPDMSSATFTPVNAVTGVAVMKR